MRRAFGFDRVIHDIQTRMQALMAVGENLKDDVPPALRAQADQLMSIIEALDTVVHTAASYETKYHFELVSLEQILQQAVKTYSHEAQRKGVTVKIAIFSRRNVNPNGSDATPHVPGSRLHLQYAFNNLVHNAIKYCCPCGDPSQNDVEIEGYPVDDKYCILIYNRGICIDADEILDKIYEDGYQGRGTLESFRKGSGKGLYFVHQVITRHGGSVSALSRPVRMDSGPRVCMNEFRIALPRYGGI